MTHNPMKTLRKRLRDTGIRVQLMDGLILPDWWEDEIATTQAGFIQGAMLISRHLGVPLAALIDPQAQITLPSAAACKFKTRSGMQSAELTEARSFSEMAARAVASAMSRQPVKTPSTDAAGIRRQILNQGAPWVGLAELLDYCWSIGIPVLHVDVPFKPKKPDGVAVMVDGRPVIVLCKKASYSAWLLFILAHEVGHIALGHIDENGVLVDEKVSAETDSGDADETAANRYAIELLTGHPVCRMTAERLPKAERLATAAKAHGRQHNIDPGHLALNLANTTAETTGMNLYPLANRTLAYIEPHPDAPALVRAKMEEYLPWDIISEESGEFIRRITGAERCLAATM